MRFSVRRRVGLVGILALATLGWLHPLSATAQGLTPGVTAELDAKLAAAMAPPNFTPPGPAIDPAPLKGKLLFTIPVSTAIPFCSVVDQQMTDFAGRAGVVFQAWQSNGQLAQWAQGFTAAQEHQAALINVACGLDPATVAPQIRNALPRFAGLSDTEVLDQPFSLADAQSLLAAERGYPSWAALKAGLAADTDRKAPAKAGAKPKMRLVEATLFVADFAVSLRYFNQVLGFATVFTYGEPPYFGQVARDGVPINLRNVCEPVFVGDIREREDLFGATIGVSGVKALFEEFRAAGAEFHQGLKRHPWGAIDFVVKDPDGNLISFGWGSADEA